MTNEPQVFYIAPMIDWSMAPDESYQYFAINADFRAHFFNMEPEYNLALGRWLPPEYSGVEVNLRDVLDDDNLESIDSMISLAFKRNYELQELMMPEIVRAPRWAKYFALDPDGCARFFKDKPIIDKRFGNRWFPSEDENNAQVTQFIYNDRLYEFVDIWNRSLIKIRQDPYKLNILEWLEEIQVTTIEPDEYNNNLNTEYQVADSDYSLLGTFEDETLANMFRLAYINMQMNNPNDEYM